MSDSLVVSSSPLDDCVFADESGTVSAPEVVVLFPVSSDSVVLSAAEELRAAAEARTAGRPWCLGGIKAVLLRLPATTVLVEGRGIPEAGETAAAEVVEAETVETGAWGREAGGVLSTRAAGGVLSTRAAEEVEATVVGSTSIASLAAGMTVNVVAGNPFAH